MIDKFYSLESIQARLKRILNPDAASGRGD